MTLPATIHIGAGSGARWSAVDPEGLLVLVEPNPALQPDLQALAKAREAAGRTTRLLTCAITDQEGTAPFHLLSLADLSGLHDPEPLRRLLPGLRIDETIRVQTRAITALIDEVPLADDGNHLIIEAMGEEGALLGVIESAGLLDRFARIEIQAPTEPLFDRGLDTAGLVARMEAADCRMAPSEAATDPDWPTLSFAPDHRLRGLRQQLRTLQDALAAATAERDSARAAADAAVADLATVRAAAEAAAVERAAADAACKAAKADLVATRDRQQARITTLENNLNEARASARRDAAALEEARGRIADLEIRLEDVEAANIQFQADLEEAAAEAAGLAADHEEAAQRHAQLKTEWEAVRQRQHDRISLLEGNLNEARATVRRLEALASQLQAADAETAADSAGSLDAPRGQMPSSAGDEPADLPAHPPASPAQSAPAGPMAPRDLQAELARLRSENTRLGTSLARSQQDASLALRLQALAQGDLKDLQGRYAALLARKEDQDRLLSQLATRLGDAAAYLQGPAAAGTSLRPARAALADEPAKALPKADSGTGTRRKKKSGKNGDAGG